MCGFMYASKIKQIYIIGVLYIVYSLFIKYDNLIALNEEMKEKLGKNGNYCTKKQC